MKLRVSSIICSLEKTRLLEAIRKIVWRVYRRTRKDEDYANYNEALNLATTKIRKSKRTFKKNWQVI